MLSLALQWRTRLDEASSQISTCFSLRLSWSFKTEHIPQITNSNEHVRSCRFVVVSSLKWSWSCRTLLHVIICIVSRLMITLHIATPAWTIDNPIPVMTRPPFKWSSGWYPAYIPHYTNLSSIWYKWSCTLSIWEIVYYWIIVHIAQFEVLRTAGCQRYVWCLEMRWLAHSIALITPRQLTSQGSIYWCGDVFKPLD